MNTHLLRLIHRSRSSTHFNLRCLTSSSNNGHHQDHSDAPHNRKRIISTFAGAVGIGAGLLLFNKDKILLDFNLPVLAENKRIANCDSPKTKTSLADITKGTEKFGAFVKGLPEYSLEDVNKHDSMDKRVWVAFRQGVYDITDFVDEHPGGDKILLGAGGSVEPFWALYAVHKHANVLEILEKYRIGNLSKDDVNASIEDMSDPYENEPNRHPVLKPSSKQPFNAEPPPFLLIEKLITPKEIFFVRNHLPVPDIDASSYELEVEGMDNREHVLSLEQIKKFPKHTIVSVVQCGGNRRSEMAKVKPIKGLNWGQAAIGNAEWTGARLYDVLKSIGIDENTKAKHVQFEGADTDPTSSPYGASIPISKAMDPNGDVLLAYEMNGEPISRDHGYPIRVIVPGTVGARNVKWLARIVVSYEESEAHWQKRDYKGFAPNIDWDTVDFSKSPAIQDMPVTSAICSPSDGEKVKLVDGKVEVKGYAYSGGGRKIVRVDVSIDGGENWQEADQLDSDSSEHPRSWGWTLWTARVPVQRGVKDLKIVAKAVDSSYNTQPAKFKDVWNLRGVLSNAYHVINVKVDGK